MSSYVNSFLLTMLILLRQWATVRTLLFKDYTSDRALLKIFEVSELIPLILRKKKILHKNPFSECSLLSDSLSISWWGLMSPSSRFLITWFWMHHLSLCSIFYIHSITPTMNCCSLEKWSSWITNVYRVSIIVFPNSMMSYSPRCPASRILLRNKREIR